MLKLIHFIIKLLFSSTFIIISCRNIYIFKIEFDIILFTIILFTKKRRCHQVKVRLMQHPSFQTIYSIFINISGLPQFISSQTNLSFLHPLCVIPLLVNMKLELHSEFVLIATKYLSSLNHFQSSYARFC